MISVSVNGYCATVEVDSFTPLSDHDDAFARELTDVLVDASDADDVKAIVLRTRSVDFSAPAAGSTVEPSAILGTWHAAFAASSALYQVLCFSKKVTVTEVTGRCGDAGSLLALCTDFTFASEDAVFGSPFTSLPESNFVLAALTMRLNRAKSWLLTGKDIPAQQALDFGLVNAVTSRESLSDEVAKIVEQISAMPLDGITMSKMLLQAVLDGHGVGREFDMADHYAIHKWTSREHHRRVSGATE